MYKWFMYVLTYVCVNGEPQWVKKKNKYYEKLENSAWIYQIAASRSVLNDNSRSVHVETGRQLSREGLLLSI